MTSKRISIIGAGYVGMSMAVLLSQKHDVNIVDIDIDKINLIKKGLSPIKDELIQEYLDKKDLSIDASCDINVAKDSDYIILSLPTNFSEHINKFDTSTLEECIKKVTEINKKALIIVKSTVPIGWTASMHQHNTNVIFSPEFLREGHSLYDNLYPSRIIIGAEKGSAIEFGKILKDSSLKDDVKILFMSSAEAESVKLFSNAYLAMRVAFFNEIDNFAIHKKLDSNKIVKGVSEDSRIGSHYNNPSFGYGGYCLPKDTKQLLANFDNVPQSLISAIIESNLKRFHLIAEDIAAIANVKIGIYKLSMKEGSDNYRHSSIIEVIKLLKEKGFDISIYEPLIKEHTFLDVKINNDLEDFKKESEIVITNRMNDDLKDISSKIYTRDLYGIN